MSPGDRVTHRRWKGISGRIITMDGIHALVSWSNGSAMRSPLTDLEVA